MDFPFGQKWIFHFDLLYTACIVPLRPTHSRTSSRGDDLIGSQRRFCTALVLVLRIEHVTHDLPVAAAPLIHNDPRDVDDRLMIDQGELLLEERNGICDLDVTTSEVRQQKLGEGSLVQVVLERLNLLIQLQKIGTRQVREKFPIAISSVDAANLSTSAVRSLRPQNLHASEQLPHDDVLRGRLDASALSATLEGEQEQQLRLLLDAVVAQCATVLKLLLGENETLLFPRDARFALNIRLQVVNRIRCLDVERDGLAVGGLHEDLRCLRGGVQNLK